MVGSILVFIIILSILVVVHEAGHFFVAKKLGVKVEEFGFGLPPKLFGKKIGETLYSLNLLPFGGFVRLHGENSEDLPAGRQGKIDPKRSFLSKSKKTRFAIVFAGVVMNFLLAIVAFAIVYSFAGVPRDTKQVKVIDVAASSPAQVAGIVAGDIVTKLDGTPVSTNDQFVSYVANKKGKKVKLELQTREGIKNITVTPRLSPPAGEGALGVTVSTTEIYFAPIWERPFTGIYYGFKDAVFWGKTVILGFVGIFKDLFAGHAPKDVSGPIGIFAVSSEAAKYGVLSVINFIGILSVNLAILNVLPFPALDGGRLFFIVLEKVIGRKILPKIEATINTVGMFVLLGLLVLITASDIKHLISAGSISKFLEGMIK